MAGESRLQAWIIAECKKSGILCVKTVCPGRSGWPDLLMTVDGRCCLVEVKNPDGTGRLSPLQKRVHEQIEEYGTQVHVIDSREAATLLITLFAGC